MNDNDYWLIIYKDLNGNQIVKPFDDDEKGTLTKVAMAYVYLKN